MRKSVSFAGQPCVRVVYFGLLVLAWLGSSLSLPQASRAETWEEAAIRLEKAARQEKIDAASRELFYAIGSSNTSQASLAISLGADVNQCVAYADTSRRQCISRMLDYAVQMYRPEQDEDGGQASLSVIRLLLHRGAMLVEDDIVRGIRNSMALHKLFAKESALLLFLESGYRVTPDLLAVALQYRSPVAPYRSSFPLQFLLMSGPYNENSLFSGRDFGPEVSRTILRHVHGLDHLQGPLEDTSGLRDISLLHLAAVTGNTEVASYLIRQGVNIAARTGSGVSPLEQAYALWIYTWRDDVWDTDFRFEQADFLDFIRLLILHGMDTSGIELDYRKRPAVYEDIFVRYCQESRITNPDNLKGTMPLEAFLDRHFARGSWTLTSYDVLDMKAPHLCTIVVTFEGTLLSDKSRVRLPLVFMDNMLHIAGDEVKDIRYPIYRNGRKLHPGDILRFWESLGLPIQYEPQMP